MAQSREIFGNINSTLLIIPSFFLTSPIRNTPRYPSPHYSLIHSHSHLLSHWLSCVFGGLLAQIFLHSLIWAAVHRGVCCAAVLHYLFSIFCLFPIDFPYPLFSLFLSVPSCFPIPLWSLFACILLDKTQFLTLSILSHWGISEVGQKSLKSSNNPAFCPQKH